MRLQSGLPKCVCRRACPNVSAVGPVAYDCKKARSVNTGQAGILGGTTLLRGTKILIRVS